MTDQELDRALTDALDVEHRADFLARVRAELGRQPAPSPSLGWWRGAAMAAMVAGVLVAAWPKSDDAIRPAHGTRVSTPISREQTSSPASSDPVASAPATMNAPRRAERTFVRTTVPSTPPAQIAPEDAQAVRLALDGLRDGLFAPAERDSAAALTLSRIDLPLLEVEPLALMAPVDSGERQ